MKLPVEFEKRIRQMLGDEAEEYFKSLDLPRTHGFRANPLKIDREGLKNLLDDSFNVKGEVPWCKDGLYYEDSFPGRHPFYHAGLYYIQEPSAMFPGAVADVKPGEKVLDICAAPGGKSVQIAGGLKGEGLLVSNDINETRVKALVKNIELSGVPNALVTNETPEKLAERFPAFFDKILVDAPCSGEGMFRKDEYAVKSWETFISERCRAMQDGILDSVDKMLKPGGKLIYSTCTFSPMEDEYTLEHFMETHKGYRLLPVPKCGGIQDGYFGMSETARLWPHKVKGEGHFTALLEKTEETDTGNAIKTEKFNEISVNDGVRKSKKGRQPEVKSSSFTVFREIPAEIKDFYKKYCTQEAPENVYYAMGENIYSMKEMPPCIDGLKVARVGTFMGNIVGGKFKPSHPFAMAAAKDLFAQTVELDPESEETERYLKGETLNISGIKGYAAVKVSGYTLGLVFGQDGVAKNLYPKGWRRTC